MLPSLARWHLVDCTATTNCFHSGMLSDNAAFEKRRAVVPEWLVIRVLLQRARLEGTKTVLVLCLVSYWSHVRSTILPFEEHVS